MIALFLNKKLCLHILIHHCVPLQTVTQNFYECNVTQNLWKKLTSNLEQHQTLSQLSQQTTLFFTFNSRKYRRFTLNNLIYCKSNDYRKNIADSHWKKLIIHNNNKEKIANKFEVLHYFNQFLNAGLDY